MPVLRPILRTLLFSALMPLHAPAGGGVPHVPPDPSADGMRAAWGPKRIYPAHSGPLLRLRRSTDSAEQDFAAGTGGWVDNAAVTAWLGGGTGFVTTAYDHGGRGWDYVQPTAGEQPSFVINGGKSYIAFASGKTLLPSGGMLDMMRYVPGLTFGLRMRQPANPTAIRWPFVITTGTSDTAPRLGIRLTTQSNMSAYMAAKWDEATTVSTAIAATGTGFISVIVQGDFIGYRLRSNVNGTVSTVLRTESARTKNTSSLSAKLNGTGTDTGGAWHMEALVIYQKALDDAAADTLKAGLDDLDSFSVPELGAVQDYSGVLPPWRAYGDSITEMTQAISGTTPDQKWTSRVSGMFSPYREVVNLGRSGETSQQVTARVLADIASGAIGPDTPVLCWMGRNNPNATMAAEVLADAQSIYDAMPAGKKVLFVSVYNSTAQSTGNPGYAATLNTNSALAAAFPDNFVDLRTPFVNSFDPSIPQDVIDHGRDCPPGSKLSDGLHPNTGGGLTIAGILHPAMAATGW